MEDEGNVGPIGEGGAFNEGWTNSLSEDIRGNEAFSGVENFNDLANGYLASKQPAEYGMEQYKGLFEQEFLAENNESMDRFKDPRDIFKSYQEARKMASRKGDIPKDMEDSDAVNEFYGKLGKPENIDGYELGEVEGADISDEYASKYKEIALKHNLTQVQAAGIFEEMGGYDAELAGAKSEQHQAQVNADTEILNKEWGDSKAEMTTAVQNLEKHFEMTPEQMDVIESNPNTLLLLGKIAKSLDEKGQVGEVFNSTRQGLEDQIEGIEAEMVNLINEDPKDPQLKVLSKKREGLYGRTGKWTNQG